jgi:hypothetical protein
MSLTPLLLYTALDTFNKRNKSVKIQSIVQCLVNVGVISKYKKRKVHKKTFTYEGYTSIMKENIFV